MPRGSSKCTVMVPVDAINLKFLLSFCHYRRNVCLTRERERNYWKWRISLSSRLAKWKFSRNSYNGKKISLKKREFFFEDHFANAVDNPSVHRSFLVLASGRYWVGADSIEMLNLREIGKRRNPKKCPVRHHARLGRQNDYYVNNIPPSFSSISFEIYQCTSTFPFGYLHMIVHIWQCMIVRSLSLSFRFTPSEIYITREIRPNFATTLMSGNATSPCPNR